MRMEATRSIETSADAMTQRNILEDLKHQQQGCESLKPRTKVPSVTANCRMRPAPGPNTTMADPVMSDANNENHHKQLRSFVNDMALI